MIPLVLYLLVNCGTIGEPATCEQIVIGSSAPVAGLVAPVIDGLDKESCAIAGMFIARSFWEQHHSDKRMDGWMCEPPGGEA